MKALAQAKKRERERQKKPMHLKRVMGQLKVVGKMGKSELTQARVLLNDLTPKGIGIFCSGKIIPGEEVQITLEQPKQFFVKGKVVWCQEYTMDSHVLSKDAYSYRIGIEFIFDNAEEQNAVRDYCEELMKKHVFSVRAA